MRSRWISGARSRSRSRLYGERDVQAGGGASPRLSKRTFLERSEGEGRLRRRAVRRRALDGERGEVDCGGPPGDGYGLGLGFLTRTCSPGR